MTIDVRVKYVNSLSEFERRFAAPVEAIGRYLLGAIVGRLRAGIAPSGQWSPLGAFSVDKPGEGLFWVAPGRPQPQGPGLIVRPSSGRWHGWAAYSSYRAYAELAGKGQPRDFEETSAFLSSLVVRVLSPTKVKVAPYGAHPKRSPGQQAISNTALGYLASRRERYPLLHPSPSELERVAQALRADVMRQAIEAARASGLAVDVRRAAAGLTRRAARVLG